MNKVMRYALVASVASIIAISAPEAYAQFSISIGVAPVCPYGYFDYEPYGCAPYGYYGREWFRRGAFIGAGPWFHGSANFRGHVNNGYDPRNGYNGSRPEYGERRRESRLYSRRFDGNEMRDGRGHADAERRNDSRR